MQRLLAALAVVIAFVAGRSTAPDALAKPVVTVQREVVAVAAPATHCPTVIEEADHDAEPETEVDDEPEGVEIADTEAVRLLDSDGKRLATLEANLGTRGAIFGRARDAKTGEILAGVTVIVSARGEAQAAITDETGYYEITNLLPDVYTVSFYFADITVERSGIAVASHKTTPVYQKIDTAPQYNPEQGITIDTNYVKNIPVPGRTFESALGSADDDVGVTISSGDLVENTYVVEE